MHGGAQDTALTRAEVREIDRLAIEELGIPGLVLMENAGLGASLRLLELPWDRAGRASILCGRGNNAGDGYVVARQLYCRGIDVVVHEAGDPAGLPPDAAANRAIASRMGIALRRSPGATDVATLARELEGAALLVDALLGTGFQGSVRAPLDAWIDAANDVSSRRAIPIAALDLPSGLDADEGRASNATIRAAWTLTFVAPKTGFRAQGAEAWTGTVFVVPIGTPPEWIERVRKPEALDRRTKD